MPPLHGRDTNDVTKTCFLCLREREELIDDLCRECNVRLVFVSRNGVAYYKGEWADDEQAKERYKD